MIAPVLEFKANPAGRVPLATLKLLVPLPPLLAIVKVEKVVPTVPDIPVVGVVIEIALERVRATALELVTAVTEFFVFVTTTR